MNDIDDELVLTWLFRESHLNGHNANSTCAGYGGWQNNASKLLDRFSVGRPQEHSQTKVIATARSPGLVRSVLYAYIEDDYRSCGSRKISLVSMEAGPVPG